MCTKGVSPPSTSRRQANPTRLNLTYDTLPWTDIVSQSKASPSTLAQ